jgi:hypothetical protein
MIKLKRKKVRRHRKRKGKGKGAAFERVVCKQLSLWWTGGKHDDIFWRTSGSGARAKVRGRKRTFGQYGDVQATNPIGQPLLNLCTIEIKCGYKSASVVDFLDSIPKKKGAKHQLEQFLEQAIEDSELRNKKKNQWLLVLKRDYKHALVITNYGFYKVLHPGPMTECFPMMKLRVRLCDCTRILVVVRFCDFLESVQPATIKRVFKE